MYFTLTTSNLGLGLLAIKDRSHPPVAPLLASLAPTSCVVLLMTCRLPWSGCPCHALHTFLHMHGIAWMGTLCHTTCIYHHMEPHTPTSVSSSRWHQSRLPLILFSMLFVPFMPPPHVPNLALLTHGFFNIFKVLPTSLNISLFMP